MVVLSQIGGQISPFERVGLERVCVEKITDSLCSDNVREVLELSHRLNCESRRKQSTAAAG